MSIARCGRKKKVSNQWPGPGSLCAIMWRWYLDVHARGMAEGRSAAGTPEEKNIQRMNRFPRNGGG